MRPSLSARIAGIASRALRRTPLAPALDSRLVRALNHRVVGMRAGEVVHAVEAFTAAGIRCWVAGGWGADALLGTETRRHDDLDLAFDAGTDPAIDDEPEARACRVLADLGFEVIERRAEASIWMPVRILAQDRSGRSIDLLPATFDPEGAGRPALPGATAFAYDDESFSTGSIAGHPVPCLSARMQLVFHRGYRLRPNDRDDLARLCDRFGTAAAVGDDDAVQTDLHLTR